MRRLVIPSALVSSASICVALLGPMLASPARAEEKTVAKDPNNIQGISPFWEKIVQGDTAAIAHDYPTAMSYYQSALTSDPKNPVGHLRLAELALKSNQLDKVPEYLDAASRFSADNLRTKIQTAFLTARMYEQKQATDEAVLAWAKYKALAIETEAAAGKTAASAVPGPARVYVTTADLRTNALKQHQELQAAYQAVRERISKNVDAADQATGAGASSTSNPAAAPATSATPLAK